MPYAALSDIQNEFKSVTFSSATHPTDSAVTGFIVQADAYINSRLRTKYVLPITDPEALALIQSIEIMLVVARVRDITRVQTGDTRTSQAGRGGDTIRQDAIKMLDSIVTDNITLPNSTPLTSANGVSSFDVDHNEAFIFQKGSDQW